MDNTANAETPKFSEMISATLLLLDNASKDYKWNCEQVNIMDKLTQDYLHALELNSLNYKERAKVATKLSKCRMKRRNHKDTARALEPLIEYLNTDRGKNAINSIKEVLGKTRKVEQKMENRVYVPRVESM